MVPIEPSRQAVRSCALTPGSWCRPPTTRPTRSARLSGQDRCRRARSRSWRGIARQVREPTQGSEAASRSGGLEVTYPPSTPGHPTEPSPETTETVVREGGLVAQAGDSAVARLPKQTKIRKIETCPSRTVVSWAPAGLSLGDHTGAARHTQSRTACRWTLAMLDPQENHRGMSMTAFSWHLQGPSLGGHLGATRYARS